MDTKKNLLEKQEKAAFELAVLNEMVKLLIRQIIKNSNARASTIYLSVCQQAEENVKAKNRG